MWFKAVIFTLHILLVLASGSAPKAAVVDNGPRSNNAYVTFVYGEEFVLGARVLGQSLRESGTTNDMVIVVAGPVSQKAITTFSRDGWRVKITDIVQNPALGLPTARFSQRFWAVYSKLSVWSLDEYDNVVFLDADTIVVRNIDDIFKCPGFCAALRHSERFNSGVMKLVPSRQVCTDMLSKIKDAPSYDQGDQGFLNTYFPKLVDGPVFDPSQDYHDKEYEFMRLPTGYNADIGLFVVNSNRWAVDDVRVIHFTFGPFKPWNWWSSWLIRENSKWNALRERLPPDAHGRREGVTGRQAFAELWLPIFPALFLVFQLQRLLRFAACRAALRTKKQSADIETVSLVTCQAVSLVSSFPADQAASCAVTVPLIVSGSAVFFGYASVFCSLVSAVVLIPPEVEPTWGWFLVYEYVLLLSCIALWKYLQFVYLWGKMGVCSKALLALLSSSLCLSCIRIPNDNDCYACSYRPAFWKAVRATLLSVTPAVAMLLVAPWVADILHVGSFVGKILVTIVFGIVTNICVTFLFGFLGVLWFKAGAAHAQK